MDLTISLTFNIVWEYGTRIHSVLNPSRPEFAIVIFVHYKPQIAVAILDL